MSRKDKRITAGCVSSKKGFVISDPSYVLSDNVYRDFWIEQKHSAYGVFDYEGSSFAVAGTAYGDGVYYDNHVNKYPVDAGVIALTPLELVSDEKGIELGEFIINELGLNLGAVFEIPGEAEFMCEDGVFDITFSNGYHVHINTKCDDDCDDDSDYSDCSDEDEEDEEDEEYNEYIDSDDEDGEYDDEYDDEYRDSYEDSEDFDYYGDREYTNDPDDDDYEE